MFSGQLAGHLCLESPLLLSTQDNPLCPRPPVTAHSFAGHLCLESPLLLSTQDNPLCPRPPVTAHSFFLLREPRLPGIPAYANSNGIFTRLVAFGIFTRLVALFPLSFTTSSDVLCSKFSGVWEMLWIFKVARWTHDRCTKINKSPPFTVLAMALELHPFRSELQIWLSCLPWAP